MNILGCLLSLLLVGVFLVFGILSFVADTLFRFLGLRKPRTSLDGSSDNSQSHGQTDASQHPKVFDDSEGEYVDFEEV